MKHLAEEDNRVPVKIKIWSFVCTAGVCAADQISKRAVVSALSVNESVALIPGFFHLTFIYNSGASFGILQGKSLYFTLINGAILLCIYLAVLFRKGISSPGRILLGIIAGGAMGNLADRLHYGAVVDFLDFRGIWSYIFNVADMAVVCGGLLFALVIILNDGKDGNHKAKPKH
ncbi:MAG: signal peptidase II [Clostridiales bacterium]|nr:signal peptidase II [Clostridiales bacterium]